MACNPIDLVKIQSMRKSGAIPLSPKIMELGSNDLNLTSPDDLRLVNDLVAEFNPSQNEKINADQFPTTIPARRFYELCGWEYYCLDVDQRPGTLHFDLNSSCFPKGFKHYFDIVTNHGTTEHVINPVMSFFAVHELTKPEGIMIHDTPIFGMGNHGFVNLTPKFWHTMAFFNEYEIIDSSVRTVDPHGLDSANFFLPHLGFMKGLEEISTSGAIINVVLRKKHAYTYLPPVDMWQGMTGEVLGRMLLEVTRGHLTSGVVSSKEICAAINYFLQRNLLAARLIQTSFVSLVGEVLRRVSRYFHSPLFISGSGKKTLG